MGLLINNQLIWISIPRCASMSIEKALISSNLDIQRSKKSIEYENGHHHITITELFQNFGTHETICIKRDWFERWISGLHHLITWIESSKIYTPKKRWVDVDNEFIYNTFTDDFCDLIYDIENGDAWDSAFGKLINEYEVKPKMYDNDNKPLPRLVAFLSVLLSQNLWKNNVKCTYEFDISELDKFNDFLFTKFGTRIDINKINESKNEKSKIIVDDKLKQWVWDKFEKRFEKRQHLL